MQTTVSHKQQFTVGFSIWLYVHTCHQVKLEKGLYFFFLKKHHSVSGKVKSFGNITFPVKEVENTPIPRFVFVKSLGSMSMKQKGSKSQKYTNASYLTDLTKKWRKSSMKDGKICMNKLLQLFSTCYKVKINLNLQKPRLQCSCWREKHTTYMP